MKIFSKTCIHHNIMCHLRITLRGKGTANESTTPRKSCQPCVGFEPTTLCSLGERSTNWATRLVGVRIYNTTQYKTEEESSLVSLRRDPSLGTSLISWVPYELTTINLNIWNSDEFFLFGSGSLSEETCFSGLEWLSSSSLACKRCEGGCEERKRK